MKQQKQAVGQSRLNYGKNKVFSAVMRYNLRRYKRKVSKQLHNITLDLELADTLDLTPISYGYYD